MKAYLVGGAVRDELLDLPVRERDWVVVGETPDSMRARGFLALDGAFPVFRDPASGDEYALARTESKLGTGHRGFALHYGVDVTLEQDLARRDLTINAIARDTHGNHVDPFGGLKDLREGRLVHITAAFCDDPLRLLRAVRFEACLAHLGFRLAPETLRLMQRMAAAPELRTLSSERVWRELRIALGGESPRMIIDRLRDCSAIEPLLPALPASAWRPGGPGLQALEHAAALGGDVDARIAGWLAATTEGEAGVTARAIGLPPTLAKLTARVVRLRDGLAVIDAKNTHGSAWMELLRAVDALRQPERLRALLPAVRGCLLALGSDTERVQTLERVRAAAASVNAATLAESGLGGPALGEALQAARIRAIEEKLKADE